jgi:hypothetical protein
MGLAQQLAGFIPDLAHASEPLCHLLKKEHKYAWSHDLQDAFDAVVKILTCDLVLINFDPSKPTILLTDASRLKGLGFALVHTEVVNGKEQIRLVTCGSHSLNPAKKSYAVVKLEVRRREVQVLPAWHAEVHSLVRLPAARGHLA